MKTLVIIFTLCFSSFIVRGEDVKPAKAIAVLGLSNSVFGSE